VAISQVSPSQPNTSSNFIIATCRFSALIRTSCRLARVGAEAYNHLRDVRRGAGVRARSEILLEVKNGIVEFVAFRRFLLLEVQHQQY